MILYTIIVLVFTLAYVFIFIFYLVGWMILPGFNADKVSPSTSCSIVIPARNEESNIERLLRDLVSQNYPDSLFEIIVVDDFSDDKTIETVLATAGSNIRLLQLKDVVSNEDSQASFKKRAIGYGIEKANGDLIITTDADCRMNPNWLQTIAGFYEQKQCHMIVAPVLFTGERNFFERLQSLDFIGLIGITGATLQLNFPTMCNGANLAFRKKSFEQVGGYAGIDRVTSGDDMLLMHKISRKWKNGVFFLKNPNAVVSTFPQRTLKDFFRQRLRWTSKSRYYADKRIAANLLLVYLFNLSIVITFLLSFLNNFYFFLFAFQFILKMIVEFSFLVQVAKYFKRQRLLWLFLPAQILHVGYVVVVGALGNFIKPTWKGRRIS